RGGRVTHAARAPEGRAAAAPVHLGQRFPQGRDTSRLGRAAASSFGVFPGPLAAFAAGRSLLDDATTAGTGAPPPLPLIPARRHCPCSIRHTDSRVRFWNWIETFAMRPAVLSFGSSLVAQATAGPSRSWASSQSLSATERRRSATGSR